jgi:hypothetical protein
MSLTITARSVITGALGALGVADGAAPPTAEDMARGFDALQELVDNWSLQALTALLQERSVYPLVANRQEYSLGPAQVAPQFTTGTAARPIELAGAGLLLATPTPAIEVPLTIGDDADWAARPIKGLTAIQPTTVYYTPTDPLGTVTLWPIPTTAANSVVLYTALLVAQFATLSADYVAAPGYAKALRWNLAKVLVADFAVPELVEQRVTREADQSLRDLKVVNVRITDLALDPALIGDTGGSYNIWTDQS